MKGRSSPVRLAIVSWLAATCWLGCGVKSAPIPPQMARPERILDLRVTSSPSGIRLSWGRPRRYASGKRMSDLARFMIMRSEGQGPFRPLAEIEVTDSERFQVQRTFNYIDGEARVGRQYGYEVVARTSDGYESLPSNRVTITRRPPVPPPNPENFVLPTPRPLPGRVP